MFRITHARRVLLPLVAFITPALASAAGCSWTDTVDHVAVPGGPDGGGGDSGPLPVTASVRFNLAADATKPPDFLEVPFPSDVYLSTKHVGVPGVEKVIPKPSGAQFLQHDLLVMNGFSRTAMAIFDIDDTAADKTADGGVGAAEIDPASLPGSESDCTADTSSVFLVDLAATDASSARVACRALFRPNSGGGGATSNLAVGPARGIVLQEGHPYAAVLTSRVKTAAGSNIGPSTDFQRIAGGTRSGAIDKLYGGAYDKVSSLLGGALSGGAKIVGIAPFTTSAMGDELYTLANAIYGEAVPALEWNNTGGHFGAMTPSRFLAPLSGTTAPLGWTATLDDYFGKVDPSHKLPDGSDDPDMTLHTRAHDKIAAIGTAVFQATTFLKSVGTTPYGPDDQTFARDGDGNISTDTSKKTPIWVTFAVPTAPPPANGYPVIIVQHGLGGSRDYLFALANVFAAKGYVTAAIDSVTFGARAPGPYQVDKTTAYSKNIDEASVATYDGPDGIGDELPQSDGKTYATNGSTALFGGLINIGALRDQFRQAALDTSQLVRVLQDPANAASISYLQRPGDTNVPKIDPTRIAYAGNSLGGIQGAMAAAIEPNVSLWALNVAGGGLVTDLAAHSPNISQLLIGAAGINFGVSTSDVLNEAHPLITLIQSIAEPGDPLYYAGSLLAPTQKVGGKDIAPRNILQIEALYDETVPNESNEALARAAGLSLASPNVGSNAGITDVTKPDANPSRIPFTTVAAKDSTGIYDTNTKHTTAVLVQTSPSQHGADWDSSNAYRQFAAPFGRFGTAKAFPTVNAPYKVYPSYKELQATVVNFFDTGFTGTAKVQGFMPPARDIDGDGTPDATDPDPNDPFKK